MFYDRLLELCRENGKKITPVIRELGLSTGGIARWRNGSSPDGDTLYKVAEYFDVSVDYLLGRETSELSKKERELIKAYRNASNEVHEIIDGILNVDG